MGNFQKLVFLHTQKVLFHTLKNNFIPYNFFSYLQSLFHTLKPFFIPSYINFIPLYINFIIDKSTKTAHLGMKKKHGGTEPDNFIPYFCIYNK
jgi:hypothetical protein